jgi:hypothetical protein
MRVVCVRVVLHLSVLLVTQVTASQHSPRGVTFLPELGRCKEGPTFYSAVYSLLATDSSIQSISWFYLSRENRFIRNQSIF